MQICVGNIVNGDLERNPMLKLRAFEIGVSKKNLNINQKLIFLMIMCFIGFILKSTCE